MRRRKRAVKRKYAVSAQGLKYYSRKELLLMARTNPKARKELSRRSHGKDYTVSVSTRKTSSRKKHQRRTRLSGGDEFLRGLGLTASQRKSFHESVKRGGEKAKVYEEKAAKFAKKEYRIVKKKYAAYKKRKESEREAKKQADDKKYYGEPKEEYDLPKVE